MKGLPFKLKGENGNVKGKVSVTHIYKLVRSIPYLSHS